MKLISYFLIFIATFLLVQLPILASSPDTIFQDLQNIADKTGNAVMIMGSALIGVSLGIAVFNYIQK